MSSNDIEFLVILALMAFFFLMGLKQRDIKLDGKYTGIDLPMSAALKGIACVLILMGHFVSRRMGIDEPTRISMVVYRTTANVALAIFMFFSGYGLSVKKASGGGYLLTWYRRIKKVYVPLFLTCIVAVILYAILPTKFSLEQSDLYTVPKDIWYLHHFEIGYFGTLISHLFGWKDWYVFCIIIFYTLFYLSQYITRNIPRYQTLTLWLMLLTYYMCAYLFIGKSEAHWYRYCWAFFIGHVYAKMVVSKRTNVGDILMLCVLMATILLESRYLIFSYAIAIVLLSLCALINKKYQMKSGILAFMGSISYFFYLSHGRISGTIMAYSGVYSVMFWTIITIIVSFGLLRIYAPIEKRIK